LSELTGKLAAFYLGRTLAEIAPAAPPDAASFPEARRHRRAHPEITFAQSPGARYSKFNDVTERKRAGAAILALNAHLEARGAERTAQLDAANRELRGELAERQRLQSQLIAVSEREQRHLGESLRDMLGQQLTGPGMMVSVLERQLRGEGRAGAESVARLGAMLKDAVKAARDLSHGFYPVVREQNGLLLALKDLAASTQSVSGVQCRVRIGPRFVSLPKPASTFTASPGKP
jgi:signal transduction histidine kinase